MDTVDWGIGHYEHIAQQLAPVAEHVADRAQIVPGELVLDVGCGTGNAATASARRGGRATGVDPAERLLEVARRKAAAESLDIDFARGTAEELPFDDASFDVVLSVFGVIFSPDPDRAIGEAIRVMRPDGRVLITVWIPEGPISVVARILRCAIEDATRSRRDGVAWHDVEVVRELAARHGADTAFEDAAAVFEAASPEAYFEREEASIPMSLAMRPVLEEAGVYDRVRTEAIAALRGGNEAADGFRVSSPYRIVTLRTTG